MKKTILTGLLPLLTIITPALAARVSPAEEWKDYAWYFSGTENTYHGDQVKTVNGEIWRDLHTVSATGRTWTVEIVGGPRTNETNTVVFTSSCSEPPSVLQPDTDLRFCLTASCRGTCTARCDRVFVKWDSNNEDNPKPNDAFELVDGDLIAGIGTNLIVMCASNGTDRVFSGIYARKVPFGRRDGNTVSVTFHGSGTVTKWKYTWRQDPQVKAKLKREKSLAWVLRNATELNEAVAFLNAKDASFWEMYEMALPEKEDVPEEDSFSDESSSVIGCLFKWFLVLLVVALPSLAFVGRKVDDAYKPGSSRGEKLRHFGACVLHGGKLTGRRALSLMRSAADRIGPKARELKDRIGPKARELRDRIGPKVRELKDRIGPKVRELKDQIAPKVRELRDRILQKIEEWKSRER